MSRGRQVAVVVLIAVAAILYGVSPIDVIPEALTGPLGLADDLAVFAGAGLAIWKILGGGRPGSEGSVPPPAE